MGLLSLLGLHSHPTEAINLIIIALLSALSLVLSVQSPGGDNANYTTTQLRAVLIIYSVESRKIN